MADIMRLFLFGHMIDNETIVANNQTGAAEDDVLLKRCFGNFNTLACVRSTFVSTLFSLTALIAVQRIIATASNRRRASGWLNRQRFVILILVLLHALLGTVEFLYGWRTEASLLSSYFRSIELIIICQYQVRLVVIASRCDNVNKIERFSIVVILFGIVYFTVLIILAYFYAIAPWYDCYAIYWIYLSSAQFMLVQCISLCCVLLWRRLQMMCIDVVLRRRQCLILIAIILSLQFASLLDLSYHVTLYILADIKTSCSGVFRHSQTIYSSVNLSFEIIAYLTPLWMMLAVFANEPNRSRSIETTRHDEDLLIRADAHQPRPAFSRPPSALTRSTIVVTNNSRRSMQQKMSAVIRRAPGQPSIVIRSQPALKARWRRFLALTQRPSSRCRSDLHPIVEEHDSSTSSNESGTSFYEILREI